MTTGPSQDIGNGTGPWLEGQLAVNAKPQAGKSWDNSFSSTLPLMALPIIMPNWCLEMPWQCWRYASGRPLEAEAFSQRHAATA